MMMTTEKERRDTALNDWADKKEADFGTDGYDIDQMVGAYEDGYKAAIGNVLSWLCGADIDIPTRMKLVARFREEMV